MPAALQERNASQLPWAEATGGGGVWPGRPGAQNWPAARSVRSHVRCSSCTLMCGQGHNVTPLQAALPSPSKGEAACGHAGVLALATPGGPLHPRKAPHTLNRQSWRRVLACTRVHSSPPPRPPPGLRGAPASKATPTASFAGPAGQEGPWDLCGNRSSGGSPPPPPETFSPTQFCPTLPRALPQQWDGTRAKGTKPGCEGAKIFTQ